MYSFTKLIETIFCDFFECWTKLLDKFGQKNIQSRDEYGTNLLDDRYRQQIQQKQTIENNENIDQTSKTTRNISELARFSILRYHFYIILFIINLGFPI